jgi:hypothetical protein
VCVQGGITFRLEINLVHNFHVPVMGTAFTIDSPIKSARFGISSVMSIGDDELCEVMRKHYSLEYNYPYEPIKKWTEDYRAERIKLYLNLVHDIVESQIQTMKKQDLNEDNDLSLYFKLLHDSHPLKIKFQQYKSSTNIEEKASLEKSLKESVEAGSLDVNIMTKIDRTSFAKDGTQLPEKYSDALAALRGFAESKVHAGIVFSAGFNRRLYSYIETFPDFFPNDEGYVKKWVIMKVSDYRSSMTQGKFLAKKGVWIKEHRIESGLNCGGHAFASTGFLLGPILEEFKTERETFIPALYKICNETLEKNGKQTYPETPKTLITVQGGIGTSSEQDFLLNHYGIDRTGWASPFLLVSEMTTLDSKTRELLRNGSEKDFYLSGVSPLGVPFNTIRGTESEELKIKRYEDGNPGSPCPKGHLVSNTEYTDKPICTASKLYQRKKLKEINETVTDEVQLKSAIQKVIDKVCLCEDLAAGALLENDISLKRGLASTVCPGPNLAYFSSFATLSEMIAHIYGRLNLLNDFYRPHMLMKELKLYLDYFKKEISESLPSPTDRQAKYLKEFRLNLLDGLNYYKDLIPTIIEETKTYKESMIRDLVILTKEYETLLKDNQSFFGTNQTVSYT